MVYWKLLISGAVRSKLGNFSRMYNVLEIADSARAVPGQKKRARDQNTWIIPMDYTQYKNQKTLSRGRSSLSFSVKQF